MNRPLRLWVDGQCLQTGSRHRGIGRYVLELCREICKTRHDVRLLVSLNLAMPQRAIEARRSLLAFLSPDQIFTWRGLAESGEITSGYDAARSASEDILRMHVGLINPDVALSASLFEGMHDAAVPYIGDSTILPWACIAYDFIPARFAENYLLTSLHAEYYTRRVAAQSTANLSLAISDFVASESKIFCPFLPCVPIYAGVGTELLRLWRDPAASLVDTSAPLPPRTIMYVGGMDWRKNVSAIVDAVALLPDEIRSTVCFAIVGEHPVAMIVSLGALWRAAGLPQHNFFWLGRKSDAELIELYRSAELCIQPSFSEGFGLNVLEGMTFGVPTLCANTGSLPEVVASSESLFDPHDAVGLSRLITRCLTEVEFNARLVSSGLKKCQAYSWHRTATLCVDALSKCARQPFARLESDPEPSNAASKFSVLLTRFSSGTLRQLRESPAALEDATPSGVHFGRRLLIDVSATLKSDGGGGIQRVVKAMVRSFVDDGVASDQFDQVFAIWSDDGRNYFEAVVTNAGIRPAVDSPKLRFDLGDTILLPDSAWPHYVQQEETFNHARAGGARIVSVVYDVLALSMPGLCNPAVLPVFSGWFQAMLRFSDAIMCNTAATAADMMRLLTDLDFQYPMAVGHWSLGNDIPHTKAMLGERAFPNELATTRKFLLVGTLEARKGHAVALAAFEQLWLAHTDVELIIIGKLGWGTERLVERLMTHPELGRRLQLINDATDEQLVSLYGEADALLAPSFAEGFGLPIVEAALFGLPVFASDIAVFREVSDSATTFFFSPGDSVSLAKLVEAFVARPRDIIAATTKRSAGLSWRESAQQLSVVAFNDAYQFNYAPRQLAGDSDQVNPSFAMQSALPPDARQARLALFEAPTFLFDVDETRFLVRVTNQSNCVWSSHGDAGGALGINLGCKIRRQAGGDVNEINLRSSFPLIVAPGESCVLEVRLPSEQLRPALTVHFELVQEGVAWWGAALVLDVVDEMFSRQPSNRPAGQRAIWVDISELAQRDVKTGIQRVTRGVVRALIETAEPQHLVVPVFATTGSRGYAHEVKWSRVNLASVKRDFSSRAVEAKSGDIFLILDLCPAVVFAQERYLRELSAIGVKVCAVVYDLLPMQLPWAFPRGADVGHRRWFEIVSKFDSLVCISEAVANEVRAALRLTDANRQPNRAPSIVVLPLASDTDGTMPTRGLPSTAFITLKKLSAATTFLMVGTIEPRKGHQQILDAFDLMWADGFDGILVIVGKIGWNVEQLTHRIQQHQYLGTRLFHLTNVSDEYLENIYGEADCLIAASYGEGFGLPIAEARRHGIPVLARDIPVFREVAGNAASFFSVSTGGDMAVAIRAWVAAVPQAINVGESNGIGLTWRECARSLLHNLNGTLEQKKQDEFLC